MAKEFTKNLTTVTTPQAAEMLGVTPQCVRAMVTDGRLSGVQPKVRAHMQIDLAAVQELQAQRQRTAASKLEQARPVAPAIGIALRGRQQAGDQ